MHYRITITELTAETETAEEMVSREKVIFSQKIEDLNVPKFIRDLNATPRRARRPKAALALSLAAAR